MPKKDNLLGKTLVVTAILLLVVFAAVIFITVQNAQSQETILEDSVRSELVSTSIAARDIIDPDAFAAYNSPSDVAADQAAYDATLAQLRSLKDEVDAQYIYALKLVAGTYVFVFDTDEEDNTLFVEYGLAAVHERAFAGEASADVLNVVDEWGGHNTGAVPIVKNGAVIGIVSTDIEDTYLRESREATRSNVLILVITMLVTMGVLFAALLLLLRRMRRMQDYLMRIANYDTITGLPNRRYLFNYLAEAELSAAKNETTFALLFIDLDNFKRVNDNAGHDAGDDLLRNIAVYLDSVQEDATTFHPTAGMLRLSARIGGDEFLQVIPGVPNKEAAAAAVQQLLDGFGKHADLQPFIRSFNVGLSIGVALYPEDSADHTTLIRYADIAMYHAKNAGKNSFVIYSETMGEGVDDGTLTVRADDRQ